MGTLARPSRPLTFGLLDPPRLATVSGLPQAYAVEADAPSLGGDCLLVPRRLGVWLRLLLVGSGSAALQKPPVAENNWGWYPSYRLGGGDFLAEGGWPPVAPAHWRRPLAHALAAVPLARTALTDGLSLAARPARLPAARPCRRPCRQNSVLSQSGCVSVFVGLEAPWPAAAAKPTGRPPPPPITAP